MDFILKSAIREYNHCNGGDVIVCVYTNNKERVYTEKTILIQTPKTIRIELTDIEIQELNK